MSQRIPRGWLVALGVIGAILVLPTAIELLLTAILAVVAGVVALIALGVGLIIAMPFLLLALLPIAIVAWLARPVFRRAGRGLRGMVSKIKEAFTGGTAQPEMPGPATDPAASARSGGMTEIDAALDALLRQAEGANVGPALMARLRAISATIRAAVARRTETAILDETAYVLRATATDYLPAILETYLRLPTQYRDRVLTAGRQTPDDLLRGQLETIRSEMDEILDAMVREDVQKMLVHGRFLEQRFGPREVPLERDER